MAKTFPLLSLALLAVCSQPKTPAAPHLLAPKTAEAVPSIYRPLYYGGIGVEQAIALRANLPYESITLERTGCFGTCPIYRVTLWRSGKAELEAKRHLPKLGNFSGEVDLSDYARLCYALDRLHFNEFEADYRAAWTDDSTAIVTATRAAGQKRVSDYGQVGPIELWTIQELIDGIRERVEWKSTR